MLIWLTYYRPWCDKCQMTEFLPSSLWFINQDQPRSLWLNVVPSKNFSLKLTDQQLRISVSLSLSAKNSKKPSCRCCKRVEENGHHSLSCAKNAGQFLRHHNLNTLVKQALTSIKVSSLSEPNGLTRTDEKSKVPFMNAVSWPFYFTKRFLLLFNLRLFLVLFQQPYMSSFFCNRYHFTSFMEFLNWDLSWIHSTLWLHDLVS